MEVEVYKAEGEPLGLNFEWPDEGQQDEEEFEEDSEDDEVANVSPTMVGKPLGAIFMRSWCPTRVGEPLGGLGGHTSVA